VNEAPDAHLLTFEHTSEYSGGSKWPYNHELTAVHPERGPVGFVKYKMSGDRATSKILIDRLEVDPDHQRKGYGSALMDALQQRHPKSSINHGDRTDAGSSWWSSYGEGRADRRGRTAAADDWKFEHHHTEGRNWRTFGGPADDPRKVMVEYRKHDDGPIEFDNGTMHDYAVRKHGPEAVQRTQQAALDHHGATTFDPSSVVPEKTRQAPRIYYHGTTAENVTHVLPAARHHGRVMFPSDTSHEHAYASLDKDAAWSYAEKAHYVTGGKPRVYQVRPMHGDHSHVEDDPQWDDVRGHSRGNYEGDRRSKVGFEVIREMKTPKRIHDSFDWPGKEDGE
jgi:GNAT superfamily N-acetyltransferase